MIDSNYRNNDIEFFLNWFDNIFSTINRVYNPSSFKKKSGDAVEYYRINDINISFFTDKIIDIIRKHANVHNPKGNTVKEMREFMETLSERLEIVKERYEAIHTGIEFKFKVRTKYVPNFLLDFLIKHADSNEKTTQREAIRLSDHNTGIGMAGKLKRFVDYMSIVESYHDIDINDIGQIFNSIIEMLRNIDDDAELSFGKLKFIFGKMLERRLFSTEKKYSTSGIIEDDDFEEKIESMIMNLSHTKYGIELSKEMKKNMENIKRIRRVFMLILNDEKERLVEGERYGDDQFFVSSPIGIQLAKNQQKSMRVISRDAQELPIEIRRMFSELGLKQQIIIPSSLNGTGYR